MKFRLLVLSSLLTFSFITHASPVQKIETDKVALSAGAPLSQAMSVDLRKGKLLFVSGQVAKDPKTKKLTEKDIQTATRQTMDNIEAILKAAGSDWKYVLRADIFLKDLNDFAGMNKEYKKRFSNGVFPARQTVQVGMKYRVEISVIAFIPDKL